MEDKLVITGVHENINGEYPCDVLGMLTVGHPNSLTNRELHRIKVLTQLTASQLFEGILSGDTDSGVGLAAVVLDRLGKSFEIDWLWDAPMGSGVAFDINAPDEDEVPPPEGALENTPLDAPETSGGVPSESE